MRRFSLYLGILLLAFSGSGFSQGAGKAYAPEDLQRLSVNDRIRVLNKEYSDLSNGQPLPNDQLEFYLDQIEESRWGFSEVRQDMQESLGSRPDRPQRPYDPPNRPPVVIAPPPRPVAPPVVNVVECGSRNNRYTECSTPFRRPQLDEQLSRTPCVEGSTWGTKGSLIWVDRGCRGEFVEGRRGPPPPPPRPVGNTDSVTCASEDGRRVNCATPFRGPARLRRQLSSSLCTEGVTWGSAPGTVWVTRGCRGLFEAAGPGAEYYPGSSSEMICESRNGGLRICPWDPSVGRPLLLREISRGACVEGRSWGVDARGLWVDRGCAGVFGLR